MTKESRFNHSKGVQKTAYKCDNPTRAMCDVDGGCYFCATIADSIEEAFK